LLIGIKDAILFVARPFLASARFGVVRFTDEDEEMEVQEDGE
jgi:hypothetical protein